MFDFLCKSSLPELSSLINLKDFLLPIDRVIHPEIKWIHQSAYLLSFDYHNSDNYDLILERSSKRKLPYIATGLINDAAAKFLEKITISYPVCIHNSAVHCEVIIHFEG